MRVVSSYLFLLSIIPIWEGIKAFQSWPKCVRNHDRSSDRLWIPRNDGKRMPLISMLTPQNYPMAAFQVAAIIPSFILSLAWPSPFGNINAAIEAIAHDPEAITCNLDNQNIRDNESSCQQLDKVVRFRAGSFFTLSQDWGGSVSTGAAIWNGANMASWYMEHVLGQSLRGASVIELGAGVGFPSLIAQKLGASEVVITDGNIDVLRLADKNIQVNVPVQQQSSIYTKQLRWNTNDELPFTNRAKAFDFIFASDVTYMLKNVPDLMACIAHLSDAHTVSFVSMEPRNVGEIDVILKEAEKVGLDWTEEQLPIDKEKSMCGMSCARMFAFKLKSAL